MSKSAFVFPGQGSQSVGMLQDKATDHPLIISTFSEASDVLGYDLWQLACEGPADKLNQTEFTQPALMAADIALWRVYCESNTKHPDFLAGHSLGEFVALVCADALDFSSAVELVSLRGQYMQAAVAEGVGAMAAIIGLDDGAVDAVCKMSADGAVLSPANFNSVGQVVIAGDAVAVDRALVVAKEQGAKIAKKIPVSVPSHCLLMQLAADRLAEKLTHVKINTPKIPVFANVDAKVHSDAMIIRDNLVKQLTMPVQWVKTIQAMQAEGVTKIVECGPGRVLQGLIKRIDKSITLSAVV